VETTAATSIGKTKNLKHLAFIISTCIAKSLKHLHFKPETLVVWKIDLEHF
jgi:hypothetical protein